MAQNEHGTGGYAVPILVKEGELVLLCTRGRSIPLPLHGPGAVTGLAPFKLVEKHSGTSSHSGTSTRVGTTGTGVGAGVHHGRSVRASVNFAISFGVALLAADGRVLYRLNGSRSERDIRAAAAALGLEYRPERIERGDALLPAPEAAGDLGALLPAGRRRVTAAAGNAVAAVIAAALGLAVFALTPSMGASGELALFLGLFVGLPLYWTGRRLLVRWFRTAAARRFTASPRTA